MTDEPETWTIRISLERTRHDELVYRECVVTDAKRARQIFLFLYHRLAWVETIMPIAFNRSKERL